MATANYLIGRQKELKQLETLVDKNSASLVVLQGRRRIGKSRLAEEFAKNYSSFQFMGLADDEKITAQMQRDEFARKLSEQTKKPRLKGEDWGDLFTALASECEHGRVIVLLDEISWMGSKDPTFLPKLKNAWDEQFSKNKKLILILCGSVSSWIQKNILNSTEFLGRPALYLHLSDLPLQDCDLFFGKLGKKLSPYEKLKMLSVTGGVPRYLELLDPKKTAENNIHHLCFQKSGVLFHEFKFIFNDIFGKRSVIYKKIVSHLVTRKRSLTEILKAEHKKTTGDYSQYLNDLELGGFIAKEPIFNLKSNKKPKSFYYRIKDNYLRFYLKYIEPHQYKIQADQFENIHISNLPGWYAMLGLQFENLILNNRNKIISLLNIPFEDIVFAGPYIQKKTKRTAGCQIDLLIQTRHRTLYVCEIKFLNGLIDPSVISEVEAKCIALAVPKNFSIRSVLIHVNGASESIIDQRYFSNIIAFSELL